MNILSVFLIAIFLLFYGNAEAETNAEAVEVLKPIVKADFTVLSAASGDLNNDNQEDWVGILTIERPSGTTQRLYVLTRGSNGLAFAEASKEVEYSDCGGGCWSMVSELKKGSFYVNQVGKGGWGSAGATTQFKLYKGSWRAIGQITFETNFDKDTYSEIDRNLLTGAYTSAANTGLASGNTKPTKKKNGIGKPSMLLLKDFDLGQF